MPFQHTPQYFRISEAIKQLLCAPLLIPYLLTRNASKARALIDADVARWVLISQRSPRFPLLYFLAIFREYRNIYYLRLKQASFPVFVVSRGLKRFYPLDPTFVIYTNDIGGGFFVQHGTATIIAAQRIGKNFMVNQQVTIGFQGPHSPVIGDNVSIRTGATVIGGVTVEDYAIIGTRALILKNVPRGAVMIKYDQVLRIRPEQELEPDANR